MTADPKLHRAVDTNGPVSAPHNAQPRIRLVPSVEPGVVFSSLASQCVLEFCDHCTIEVFDGVQARYRIVYPPAAAASGGLLRLAERAGREPGRRIEVPFAHTPPSGNDDPGNDESQEFPSFRGRATFTWDRRAPVTSDHTMAAVLVEHAVHVVLWQRSEHLVAAANTRVDNLQIALINSRDVGTAVGVLMSRHKITSERAFELLRTTSQRSNRKVRDLAADVIATGWLGPPMPPARI